MVVSSIGLKEYNSVSYHLRLSLSVNWASAWKNYICCFVAQNGGSLSETAFSSDIFKVGGSLRMDL